MNEETAGTISALEHAIDALMGELHAAMTVTEKARARIDLAVRISQYKDECAANNVRTNPAYEVLYASLLDYYDCATAHK